MSDKSKTVQFGSLGSVEVELWEKPDVEIFAKYVNSVNGGGGPTYDDDCNLGPCSAVTFIE